ncbi:hypothetical protein G6F42_010670 [Rhizopus arrhizus]|nr:hypothetical protein G6F42_010670 [Rhizopus arrhizus]
MPLLCLLQHRSAAITETNHAYQDTRVIDAANSGFARQYVTLQYGADMEYFDGVYDEVEPDYAATVKTLSKERKLYCDMHSTVSSSYQA